MHPPHPCANVEDCACQVYGFCGGGDDDPPSPPANPCDQANALAANTQFKTLFNNLKNNTTGNQEHVYVYNPDATSLNETELIGEANSPEVNFGITGKIDGYLHSHFPDCIRPFPLQIYKQ